MLLHVQSTVKHQLSAEDARVQAAELLRKAKLKREKEEAETARLREKEVGDWVSLLSVQACELHMHIGYVSSEL